MFYKWFDNQHLKIEKNFYNVWIRWWSLEESNPSRQDKSLQTGQFEVFDQKKLFNFFFAKLKTFEIKRSTGPRPTARLLEPVDDDIFNVWFDHENQVVRMGRRFLFHHFLR